MRTKINWTGGFVGVLSFAIGLFVIAGGGTAHAAPPQSITITGSGLTSSTGSTECGFRINNNANYAVPVGTAFLDGTGTDVSTILDDPALNADYEVMQQARSGSQPLVHIRLYSLNGTGTNNANICNGGGIFFSLPSNPTRFVGYYAGGPVQFATLSQSNSQINFAFGAGSIVSYDLTENSDSAGIIASPIFSPGGSTGFCTGVSGAQSRTCMLASVSNFNSIQYRGETYQLRRWEATGTDNNYLVYDLAATTVSTRQALATNEIGGTCGRPYIRINVSGQDAQDLNVDGEANNGDRRDFVNALNNIPGSFSAGFIDMNPPCTVLTRTTITLNSFTNMNIFFVHRAGTNTISFDTRIRGENEQTLVSGSGTFTRSATDPLLYEGTPFTACSTIPPTIRVSQDLSTYTGTTPVTAVWTAVTDFTDCANSPTANVRIRIIPADSTEVIGTPPAGEVGSGTDGGSDDPAQEPEPTCSSEGGALGWILCPGLTLMDETTQFLESQLRDFLFIDQSQFEQDGDIYQAWSTFRSIATVIIVIVALVMIFSQAMGDGIFDNYSVKKLLPRLIIAGIGIQLSWFLMIQLVNLSNVIGDGIGGLIGSPFGISPTSNLRDQLGGITGQSSGGDFFTGLVVIGAAGFAIIGAIVPLAIGVVAALFVGLITLVVRNMIILLGVVLAPVAIAMSVLPGTQKTSKLWWESLEKALLMYPIVIALLMAGKIVGSLLFASATPSGDAGVRMVPVIAGVIAWYAPFFLLPKALQAGGAALGKISGLAGDRSKGIFDRAKNWDTDRKKKMGDIKTQQALSRGGLRGGFASFKAGNIGGIRGNTRGSTRMARDQQRADAMQKTGQVDAYMAYNNKRAAEIEQLKAQGLYNPEIHGTGSLLLDQAQVKADQIAAQARQFDLKSAKTEIETQEAKASAQRADLLLQQALGPQNYGKSDELAKIVEGTSTLVPRSGDPARDNATVKAALNRMVTLGADGDMRKLVDNADSTTPTLSADAIQALTDTRLSGDFAGAFKDKAPDLVKGSAGAFGDTAGVESLSKWSKGTWQKAVQVSTDAQIQEYMSVLESDPDLATAMDPSKRAAFEAEILSSKPHLSRPIIYAKKQIL